MGLGDLMSKMVGKSLDVPEEIEYEMLVDRLVQHWKQKPIGKGLSDGMLRQLAREALNALGLDRLQEDEEEKS